MKTENAIRIVIIGGGNVAFHLASAWKKSNVVNVVQLYNRSIFSQEFDDLDIAKTNHLPAIDKADVYIIAVSDDAISEISEQLPFGGCLVVHTSGNTPMEQLNGRNRRGVFYPLQSFSKKIKVDFSEIPICIEAENPQDLTILERLGKSLTKKVFHLDSFQRKKLHAAAVFANNFSNYMLTVSEEICRKNDIPFEILAPLIKETFEKSLKISPYEAQTGPARRNDQKTIGSHLKLLDEPQKKIYKTITDSIIELYGKEKL